MPAGIEIKRFGGRSIEEFPAFMALQVKGVAVTGETVDPDIDPGAIAREGGRSR